MARIKTYEQDSSLNKLDKLLGTDSATDGTKNFTISSLIQLINDLSAINIFDGLSYEYQAYDADATDPEGILNLTGTSLNNTAFSAITQLIISKKGHQSPDIENYINALEGGRIKLSEQGDIDNFGIFRVVSIQDYTNDRYMQLTVEHDESNGTLTAGTRYHLSNYQASIDSNLSTRNVTEFGDVTSAGSGVIITTAERNIVTNALTHGDVVDNVTSTGTDVPLSANQGKVLKGLIDSINTLLTSDNVSLDTLQEVVDYIETNRNTLDNLAISNITGLQSALNGKQNTEAGKGLSANDFTDLLLQKLNGIAAGAQVNVQTDWNGTGDAAILNKPNNFIYTSSSVTDLNDVYDEGSGYIITDDERNKLDGIAAGAEVNVQADWNATSGDAAILNKPTLAPSNAEANIQANWNETDNASDAFIQNKPDITTKADKATSITVQGTTNEIEVTPDTAQDLSANRTVTVGLPDDVTVTNDLTVGNDLNVTDAMSVGESIQITETLSTTPTFDNGIYFTTEDNHDTLHFRYHGRDLSIDYLTEIIPTGILNGGGLTKANNTQFTIAAGDGVINELNKSAGSDPHPEIKKVKWATQTITVSNLDSGSSQEKNSWIYVDDTGAVQQKTGGFTEADYRTSIPIGAAIHSSGIIRLIKTFPRTAYNNMSQLNEFAAMFGPMKKSGHVLSANGSNLSLDRSSGVAFAFGRNYVTDPENPSTVSDGSKTQCVIHRYYRDGSGGYTRDTNAGAGYTTIDPTKYDDNSGTLATHSSFMFTIQRFYYFPATPDLLIQYYGRDTYMSMEAAERNLPTDPHGEAENTAGQAIYLGAIIVQQNCTDLTNTADAKFFASGAFRSLVAAPVGAVAAAALSDLTDANVTSPTNGQVLKYNSSTQQFENQDEAGGDLTPITLDATNNRVGINNTVPGQALSVDGNVEIDGGTGVATSGTLVVRQKGDTSNDGIALTSSNGTSHRIHKTAGGALQIGPSTDPDALTQTLAGRLGVGTGTPNSKLNVVDSGADLRFYGDTSGNAYLYSHSGDIRFRADGGTSNILALDNNLINLQKVAYFHDKVGVGVSSPSTVLHVNSGTINNIAKFESTDSAGYITIADNSTTYSVHGIGAVGDDLILYANGADRLHIASSGAVGVGTNSPDASLHIDATDAIIVPKGTDAERDALTAESGMFRFNTTTNEFEGYDGTEWGAIAGSGGGTSTFNKDLFSGDDSTTSFTMAQTIADENNTQVYIDGVYQSKENYTVNGTAINFSTAPPTGTNNIEVISVTSVALEQTNTLTRDGFTGDGSTTAFTLSVSPTSEDLTFVYIQGVYQEKSTYSISGSTITFTTAPQNGYTFEVMSLTAANITQTSYMASDSFSTPTQGQTSFTLVNGTPSNKAFTMVFISGVYQDKSTYSLTNGSIVLSQGVDTEDTVEVISIGNGGVMSKAVSDANDARYSVNVISANDTAVAGAVYVFTASLTLTLPASPEVGDSIKISNRSGVETCVLGRNGNKILGAAEDLTLDTAAASFELIYSGTAQGWVIIGQ